MSIGVGTRGVPGARAPPSFQSVPYISCTTNEILHTVPPQSKSLSYASIEACEVHIGHFFHNFNATVSFGNPLRPYSHEEPAHESQ